MNHLLSNYLIFSVVKVREKTSMINKKTSSNEILFYCNLLDSSVRADPPRRISAR